MLREIIVNVSEDETRVAVLENRVTVELYIERSLNQRLMGNIYKGRVENVLPGMQAAFVDIGMEKNAFLYVEDAVPPRNAGEGSGEVLNIRDVLRRGQEIVVQVMKEPAGTKGPRVTTHLTIPGRFLVLMPTVDYIGVSRRIVNDQERERLKKLAERVKPKDMGLIVRTVAEGVSEDDLRQDVMVLQKLWNIIVHRSHNRPAPVLLHRDLELIQRVLRDVFSEDVDRLVIDSRDEYEKVMEFLDISEPYLKSKVVLEERENIFRDYGIEPELEKALSRKVWLKCGGYLVIDQTEALTAVDVNTGKYTGSTDLEDTVLTANLEAACEIARQIRLRSIGGIIVVDFIDMNEEGHWQQVLEVLEREIKRDKTKTHVLGVTRLGLVEMTRKKVRPSLAESIQRKCPYCDGKGKVFSEETMSIRFKEQVRDFARHTSADAILVETHPAVAARLIGFGGASLRELERKTGKTLHIRGVSNHHIEAISMKPLNREDESGINLSPVKPGEILEVKVEEPHINNNNDGIARLDGFILNIEGAGVLVGETVPVRVSKVYRTYAKAKLLHS